MRAVSLGGRLWNPAGLQGALKCQSKTVPFVLFSSPTENLTHEGAMKRLLVILMVLSASLVRGQSLTPLASSVLAPYTKCAFSDQLSAVSVDHLDDAPMIRSVNTASGSKPVSVADGYRVMLAYPNTDYFVNLKIEQSVTGRFTEDKQHIIAQMHEMASQSSGRIAKVEQMTIKGITVFGLNNQGIEGGGVVSFYTLFDDPRGVVVTAYILNGDPQHRAFQSMAQYRVLRDRFLNTYASCMSTIRPGFGSSDSPR
jgi:hypothetical protein